MAASGRGNGSGNNKTRAGLYGMGALYLAYLFYQIARPFLAGEADGPTGFQFALGAAILGGGAVALGLLAWTLYKKPLPEEDDDSEESGGE